MSHNTLLKKKKKLEAEVITEFKYCKEKLLVTKLEIFLLLHSVLFFLLI